MFHGEYARFEFLKAAVPVAVPGDFAIITKTQTIYGWDEVGGWYDTHTPVEVISRTLPSGGHDNQVLVKNGEDDYELQWVNPTSIIPVVQQDSNPGLMSGPDKTKLDGIAAGAEVNVNADWEATSGKTMINNKPSILLFSGTHKITVGTTEPTSPQVGDVWIDTN